MNPKGQGFEVFNILIGTILALAILVIIISIIAYFEEMKFDSSIQAIKQKLNNAAQSPDGSVFVSKNVVIPKNYSFNSKWVSEVLNINEQCVEFDFPMGSSWAEYPNQQHNLISFTKRTETDFYVLCKPDDIYGHQANLDCDNTCEFCCLLSFGVNPGPAN